MKPTESPLETLLELQILDRVKRTGYVLRGVAEAESVAEHGYHVAFLVWALGRREPDLDLAHAIGLALVHDVAEVRLGDLPSTARRYLSREVKHAAEGKAMTELLGPLAEDAAALHDELDRGESAEARFVRACDKLQLMIKVLHYQRCGAAGLDEFWENQANFPPHGFASVDRVFEELVVCRRGLGDG